MIRGALNEVRNAVLSLDARRCDDQARFYRSSGNLLALGPCFRGDPAWPVPADASPKGADRRVCVVAQLLPILLRRPPRSGGIVRERIVTLCQRSPASTTASAKLRVCDDPAIRGALSWCLDLAERRHPANSRIAGPSPSHKTATNQAGGLPSSEDGNAEARSQTSA